MLVAEVVAHRADKKLDFGDWDGDGTGKAWTRELRFLITARDIDADIDIEEPALSSNTVDSVVKEICTDSAPQPFDNLKETHRQLPIVATANTGYDSDDSLTGYASPSSRSTSPTPSELEEIEHDPSLRVGVKKIPRPVYLAQLGELVRSTSGLNSNEPEQEADKMEMALNCGEELIRKKQGYGMELGTSRSRYLGMILCA
jgi:telomere length regulation protein